MQDATFCTSIAWELHHDRTLVGLHVFTVFSPMCCFHAKIETKNGSNDGNKFVYKPTKWVTDLKVLAEPSDRRYSNSSGLPWIELCAYLKRKADPQHALRVRVERDNAWPCEAHRPPVGWAIHRRMHCGVARPEVHGGASHGD